MEEDFAVYNFDSLELGEENLNNFYNEEEDQDWNDEETFGDLNDDQEGGGGEGNNGNKPIGRDFDFAGSTSRFLGGQSQYTTTQQVLTPADSSWTNTSQPSKFPSPWSTLDADPLLSSRPLSSKPPLLPPSTPVSIIQQVNSATPKRVMRTLEEIEAELRNQQSRPTSVLPAPAPPPRQGKTLEEIEAEMLRGRQHQQQQQQMHPQQMQQQQQYYQQQQNYLPNSNSPFPPQQFPYPPQQQQQQFPPQFQQQMQQQQMQQQQGRPNGGGPLPSPGNFPPGMLPSPRPGQQSQAQTAVRPSTPSQQQQQQQQQQIQHQQHIQHQQQLFAQHQQHIRATQLAQQVNFPVLPTGPGPNSGMNLMNTLFPPLPSQINNNNNNNFPVPVPTVVSLEQQLIYLSKNQHAQHPSLTGAQLQVLLQQAQQQVASTSIDPSKLTISAATAEKGEGGVEKEVDEEEREAKLKLTRAGEELIRNVEERIREHEMIELKRKVKAAKIQGMAKHNNLMSNSDKDFITRIQVSQLVTDDPYADDFYFHIMAAIKQSRMAAQRNAELLANGGGNNNNGPNGMGIGMNQQQQQGGQQQGQGRMHGGRNNNDRRPTRRENAMNKMAQNVQRLVDNAKQRNKSGQLSIDGALGKIALRTRSAPRQLLQVTPATTSSPTPSAGHALLAGLISSSTNRQSSTSNSLQAHDSDSNEQLPPLTHRAVLSIVEEIYDAVLDLEQLRRIHPGLLNNARLEKEYYEAKAEEEKRISENGEQEVEMDVVAEEGDRPAQRAVEEWQAKCAELSEKLWTSMRVMEPLDISVPHPFISLISVLKGKRILPRALRHCSPEQTLTLLTLMVATFDTLDTVVDAPLLDRSSDPKIENSEERKALRSSIENKTEVFLHAIISPVMSVIGSAPLRLVTGMLGLLIERNDILKVVRSKPGVAFLTVFLARAESLKQATPAPEAQDLQQWQQVFRTLFNSLSDHFPSLFPSTRAVPVLPFGVSYYLQDQVAATTDSNSSRSKNLDLEDEPVWRFLAAVAVCADPQEQQDLVTAVRDKVLENVSSAKKLKVTPEVAALKIRNVDLLLNSLGLSATQLTVDD